MALFVSAALFAILTLVISIYGYHCYARPPRLCRQLGGPVLAEPQAVVFPAGEPGDRVVARIVCQIGRWMPVSPPDARSSRRELVAAGYRSENALQIYYGVKVLAGAILCLLMLLFRDSFTVSPVLRVLLAPFGALAGYSLPSFLLGRMVRKRQERLRLSLPDALDLMVISVEAGLGLDQAVQNVSHELAIVHRELSEELGLVMLEMRAGKRRADALKNLAERTGEAELRKLVAILTQTDRFGTSMAEALRTHSDFMRVRRKQDAEERAGKVGVKLVFPIFFFILPSMLVVTAGPGLLQVFKNLFPMMKNFGG